MLSNNFSKLKCIEVIFVKQHERSKEKLTVQQKSTSTSGKWGSWTFYKSDAIPATQPRPL